MDIASLWQELEGVLTPILADFRSKGSLRVEQKADASLLSEADEAVQAQIVECVRAVDAEGTILGEEGIHGPGLLRGGDLSSRLWIIDPIDGTAQFVARDGREYCSVVCLLEDRRPVAAFVLAPEIGPARGPVRVSVSGPGEAIEVNGRKVHGLGASGEHPWVSVTRSSGTQPRLFEERLQGRGYRLKTRTTSQSLDMVRASVDLTLFTKPVLEPFGLFYRERQKVWDGAAGMCFAKAAGLYVGDGAGSTRTDLEIELDSTDPVFESTLVASDLAAARVVIEALQS